MFPLLRHWLSHTPPFPSGRAIAAIMHAHLIDHARTWAPPIHAHADRQNTRAMHTELREYETEKNGKPWWDAEYNNNNNRKRNNEMETLTQVPPSSYVPKTNVHSRSPTHRRKERARAQGDERRGGAVVEARQAKGPRKKSIYHTIRVPPPHTTGPPLHRGCTNRARVQLILSNSTSNRRVALGGMTGGKPRAPYA